MGQRKDSHQYIAGSLLHLIMLRNYPREFRISALVRRLGRDVARSDKRTRAVATRKIAEGLETLGNSIRETSGEDKGAARSLAIMTWCALVGAITLARAVSDEQLSRES